MTPAYPAEDLPTCLIQAQELQEQTRPVSRVNLDPRNYPEPAENISQIGTHFQGKTGLVEMLNC
jgi:hypothetical protein